MRKPIFEPAITSNLGMRSTETPAGFSTLTVEFRSSSLVGEMLGAGVACGASGTSGTSGRIVTDRGVCAKTTVPTKIAADSPAKIPWAIPNPNACGFMRRSLAELRGGVEAGSADPGIGRRIALDQLVDLDRGATLTHFFQRFFEIAKSLRRRNGDHLIGPERLTDPHLELVVRSVDNAFVRAQRIQGLHRAVASDVEHQERALR